MVRRWLALVAALVMVAASLTFLVRAGDDEPDGTAAIGRGTLRTGTAPVATLAPQPALAVTPSTAPVSSPSTTTVAPRPPLVDGVAFVGDSLAENLALGLGAASLQRGLAVFDGSISGCGVTRSGAFRLSGIRSELSPTCAGWSDRWAEDLRRDRPAVVAIQVGRHEVLDRQYRGQWTNIFDPQYRAYVKGELELGIRVARAEGAKVVLLTAPRFHRPEQPGGGQWPENDPARVDRFNDLLRDLAMADRSLVLIDLGARTSPGRTYVDIVDGVAVRSDGVHYSRAGVEWIGPWLLPQLAALLRP